MYAIRYRAKSRHPPAEASGGPARSSVGEFSNEPYAERLSLRLIPKSAIFGCGQAKPGRAAGRQRDRHPTLAAAEHQPASRGQSMTLVSHARKCPRTQKGGRRHSRRERSNSWPSSDGSRSMRQSATRARLRAGEWQAMRWGLLVRKDHR